jgi:hypothetical protein
LAIRACARFCIITVLPLFGAETSRARWPLPMGAIRSTMRLVMFSSDLTSRSSLNCSLGKSGVRFSNMILCLLSSGERSLILSTFTSAK